MGRGPAPLFWDAQERRVRSFWRIAIQQGAQAALAWLPLSVAFFVFHLRPDHWSGATLLVFGASRLFGTLASVALAARFIDRRPLADFGLRLDRQWWSDLAFGLGLGAFLMTGVFAVEREAGWVTVVDALHSSDAQHPFPLTLLTPLAVFLMVGVYEELGYRGYILRNLAEGMGRVPGTPRVSVLGATALSSMIFGLAHAGNPNATLVSTANVAAAGVLLALGYVLTGRLALPIGLHITWNFFQGNVYGFPVSGLTALSATFVAIRQEGPALWTGGDFGPEAGLVGLLAMTVGSGLIVLWVRGRYGKIALAVALAEPLPATGPAGSPPPAPSEDASGTAGPPPGDAEGAR